MAETLERSTKEVIYRRDDFTCQSCKKKFKPSWEIEDTREELRSGGNFLVADHMDPAGPSTLENLRTLCFRCKASKASSLAHAHLFFSALQRLGRPISFYPSIAKIIGMKECLFLCQIIYWMPRGRHSKEGGWVYKTADEIEQETSLSYKEQLRIKKALSSMGLLEEEYRRQEHTAYFRACVEGIEILLGEHLPIGHMPEGKMPPLEHLPKGKMAFAQKSDGICPKVSSYIRNIDYTQTTALNLPPPLAPTESPQESITDPRHHEIREAIKKLQTRCGGEEIWDGSAGDALARLLKLRSKWSAKLFLRCVANRFASQEANPLEHPRRWLESLSDYAAGPLDRYGKLAKSRGSYALELLSTITNSESGPIQKAPKPISIPSGAILPNGDDPWKAIKAELRNLINPQSWETWIRPTRLAYTLDGKLFVAVPQAEFKVWIQDNFSVAIDAAKQALKLEFMAIEFLARVR